MDSITETITATATPFTHRPAAAPDRYVLEPECKGITGLARATRHRLWRTGLFPTPYEISPGRHGWLLSELIAWMATRKKVA